MIDIKRMLEKNKYHWVVKNETGIGLFMYNKKLGGNFLLKCSKDFQFTRQEAISKKNEKFGGKK